MEKYKTLSTLGDGAFGSVYKAKNIKNGQIVAIKKMKQKYSNWNQCIELRQIKSLRKLDHQNVIKLKEVLLVGQQLYMVFEYLDYNLYDVYSKMKESNKKFTEKQIKSMIYQIVQGLAHMHKHGFFHRDMKPENLLIYNNVVKVCDLGLARQIRSRPPFTDYVSTRWYRAPQLLLRSTNYNSPVDIFALGCIMAELYTLCPLFPGNNQIDQMNKIVKILGTPDKADWPEGYKLGQAKGYYFPEQPGISLIELIPNASMQAIDLIQSMLRYNSRKRPTAQQVLKHQYFQNVSVPKIESAPEKIVFESKPEGAKLNTEKQDKKIDQFRQTKRKFKQTRKHDAMQKSSLWANVGKKQNVHHHNQNNDLEDLDSLIKQLEDKGKKKNNSTNSKLPLITNTKDKFYHKKQKPELRQSKTEIKHGQPYFSDKQYKLHIQDAKVLSKHKQKSSYKKPPSKSQILPSKFSYSFNPVLNPAYSLSKNNAIKAMSSANFVHPNIKSGLSSIKTQLKPMNLYKY